MHINLSKIILALVISIMVIILPGGCVQVNRSTAALKKEADMTVKLEMESVQQENIIGTIERLASEQYKGRLTGASENRMAAQYISGCFKKLGLEEPKGLDDYMQLYTQPSVVLADRPVMQLIGKDGKIALDFRHAEEFVLRRLSSEDDVVDIEADMFLVNSPDQLTNANKALKDKVILLPWKFYELLGGQNVPKDLAELYGARAVISEFDLNANQLGYKYLKVRPLSGEWIRSEAYKPFAFVESNTFLKLAEGAKAGGKLRLSCKSKVNINNIVANVIGIIPGSDPELKDRNIIISAHYDHVGDNMNGSYNPGALDNASGTAVMLELARVIKEGKTAPKQSIIFIAFNGEESGLYGSRYYCRNPVKPLGKAVVINLDMVGTAAKVPLSIATTSKLSDTSLQAELAESAEKLGIQYIKLQEGGSDHAAFDGCCKSAVTLINMDLTYGYHSPRDTVEAVSGVRAKEIAGLIIDYLNQAAY